jgi:hypothetical protein
LTAIQLSSSTPSNSASPRNKANCLPRFPAQHMTTKRSTLNVYPFKAIESPLQPSRDVTPHTSCRSSPITTRLQIPDLHLHVKNLDQFCPVFLSVSSVSGDYLVVPRKCGVAIRHDTTHTRHGIPPDGGVVVAQKS